MSVRMQFTQRAKKILSDAEKLSGDLDILKEKTGVAALKRQPFEGGIAKTEKEAADLFERRRKIGRAILMLESNGKNYFKDFEPTKNGKHKSENPVEKAIHEAWQLGNYFDTYIETVKKDLILIKSRK